MTQKRHYKFTGKKHSKRGIFALILALLSLAGLVGAIILSFLADGNGSRYLGCVGVVSMLIGVAAFFHGLMSLKEENSYRVFPYLAVICGFFAAAVWIAIYTAGFVI